MVQPRGFVKDQAEDIIRSVVTRRLGLVSRHPHREETDQLVVGGPARLGGVQRAIKRSCVIYIGLIPVVCTGVRGSCWKKVRGSRFVDVEVMTESHSDSRTA